MENKIQELTDKIYREGVEKGNEEAQKLTEESIEQVNKEDKIGYIELLLFIINVYNANGCIESVKEYCELSLELDLKSIETI